MIGQFRYIYNCILRIFLGGFLIALINNWSLTLNIIPEFYDFIYKIEIFLVEIFINFFHFCINNYIFPPIIKSQVSNNYLDIFYSVNLSTLTPEYINCIKNISNSFNLDIAAQQYYKPNFNFLFNFNSINNPIIEPLFSNNIEGLNSETINSNVSDSLNNTNYFRISLYIITVLIFSYAFLLSIDAIPGGIFLDPPQNYHDQVVDGVLVRGLPYQPIPVSIFKFIFNNGYNNIVHIDFGTNDIWAMMLNNNNQLKLNINWNHIFNQILHFNLKLGMNAVKIYVDAEIDLD